MSINEKEETEKLYYSISEVSELFDLNASTLRFWEKEFDVLKPTKNKKDIEHIASIVELVKQKGFTIQGAKDQLKNRTGSKSGGNSNAEVIEKLRNIKAKLIELRDKEE